MYVEAWKESKLELKQHDVLTLLHRWLPQSSRPNVIVVVIG